MNCSKCGGEGGRHVGVVIPGSFAVCGTCKTGWDTANEALRVEYVAKLEAIQTKFFEKETFSAEEDPVVTTEDHGEMLIVAEPEAAPVETQTAITFDDSRIY